MKNTLTFMALSLLLTSCSRRDAQLAHQISGVWQVGTAKVTFNPDGGFSNRTVDGRGTNEYAGTWQVRGGFLTMTLTNATGSHPDGRVGENVRLQVVDADEHHISCLVGGQTNTFSR